MCRSCKRIRLSGLVGISRRSWRRISISWRKSMKSWVRRKNRLINPSRNLTNKLEPSFYKINSSGPIIILPSRIVRMCTRPCARVTAPNPSSSCLRQREPVFRPWRSRRAASWKWILMARGQYAFIHASRRQAWRSCSHRDNEPFFPYDKTIFNHQILPMFDFIQFYTLSTN